MEPQTIVGPRLHFHLAFQNTTLTTQQTSPAVSYAPLTAPSDLGALGVFWLSTISGVTIAQVVFFSAIASVLVPCDPGSSVTATSKPAAKANLNLCWLSYEAPFHIYNLEYVHNVYLTVNTTYQGILVYYARGVRKHCHDDGVWCVKHGGPQSPEMTIWYKGLEYQHGNWTVDCGEHLCQQMAASLVT
ncbi:MAG: hypothetical protein JOS17DRAFT_798521 [Linnemannia elongata]|nr:MAG: hypothetical protein JOS17DRAFT_798521 [Linnemannia elongata]